MAAQAKEKEKFHVHQRIKELQDVLKPSEDEASQLQAKANKATQASLKALLVGRRFDKRFGTLLRRALGTFVVACAEQGLADQTDQIDRALGVENFIALGQKVFASARR